MELMVDYDINGEVFIPLENGNFLDSKKDITYQDIQDCYYTQFRNVLFQGEILKFYIVLKCDNKSISIDEDFYFKIEFESTEVENLNIEGETQIVDTKDDLEKTMKDLFTINTEQLNEKNFEYEKVANKNYDKEKNAEVYEIYKQIIVPEKLLGKVLIMKLQLMMKNEDSIDFKENFDALKYYQNGHYKDVTDFKVFKTFFKEVKIVRPLIVSNPKQVDLTVNNSLLMACIENTTQQIDFIDYSLKTSKFLKKKEKEKKPKIKSVGNNMIIKEIIILEDETTINESLTKNMNIIKNIFVKNDKVSMDNISFQLCNKNFPLTLLPGEIFNIVIKIIKNSFLNEKTDLVKNPDDNNNSANLTTESSEGGDSKTPTTTENSNSSNNSDQTNKETKPSENQQTSTTSNKETKLNPNSIVVTRKTQFRLSNEERLASLSNIGAPIYTEHTLGGIQKNIFGNKNNGTSAGNINENEEEVKDINTNTYFIGDENIKVYFNTPVIFYVSSNMFFEDLFICLQMKWINELNRFLKIELNIPQNIQINTYFDVKVKIRNISASPMNLFIEMKENDSKQLSIDKKGQNIDPMPAIIAQTKFETLGMLNGNEDKIFSMKFLAIKLGFTQLPNFAITDTLSNKRFYIVQSNKILILDNKNVNKEENVLNRLISSRI